MILLIAEGGSLRCHVKTVRRNGMPFGESAQLKIQEPFNGNDACLLRARPDSRR
ncbi:hypothetical protein GHT06_020913 [Daphnia sinensis]|uniref:Uncharacterized protein n=1 Tax=Daphnia sinensis TaxID=1820382 RepID=A0AAD5KIE9_9CRUS|nr:hypothetical protein GHT06_020913 [Daphnia sinensis]